MGQPVRVQRGKNSAGIDCTVVAPGSERVLVEKPDGTRFWTDRETLIPIYNAYVPSQYAVDDPVYDHGGVVSAHAVVVQVDNSQPRYLVKHAATNAKYWRYTAELARRTSNHIFGPDASSVAPGVVFRMDDECASLISGWSDPGHVTQGYKLRVEMRSGRIHELDAGHGGYNITRAEGSAGVLTIVDDSIRIALDGVKAVTLLRHTT